jgi:FAD/FMN-containing dehydrogenase
MIGNNSCGIHALMGGMTVDNIESLDILLYDGIRMRVGRHSEDDVEAIIRKGGARVRFTLAFAKFVIAMPNSSANGFPESPGVSPDTSSTSYFPKTAFT